MFVFGAAAGFLAGAAFDYKVRLRAYTDSMSVQETWFWGLVECRTTSCWSIVPSCHSTGLVTIEMGEGILCLYFLSNGLCRWLHHSSSSSARGSTDSRRCVPCGRLDCWGSIASWRLSSSCGSVPWGWSITSGRVVGWGGSSAKSSLIVPTSKSRNGINLVGRRLS